MSGDDSDDANRSWYARNVEPPRFQEEAYGYWVFVTGSSLVLVAAVFLMLQATAENGTPLFWTARQAAAVLGGAGFPLIVLGFVYRLPVGGTVYRLAFVGVVVCLAALALFVRFYPDAWGATPTSLATDRSSQVVSVYAAGILVVVLSATVLPVVTRSREGVSDESPAESDARFELFRDVSADWRWRLRDDEGSVVADSDEAYLSEEEAERSLEGFRDDVTGAPVETRDVLEDRMLSEGTAAVGEGATHTETPGIEEGSGSGARFELREEGEGKESEYFWRLRDSEGNTLVAAPEDYEDRDEAEAAAEAVRGAATEAGALEADPVLVAVYTNETGDWVWSLRDGEGNELAAAPETYEERGGVITALGRLASGEGLKTEVRDEGEGEGGWRWRLVHTNGEALAASAEGYEERGEAEEAAELAKEHLSEAEPVEVGGAYFAVYRDEDGGWRWSLCGRGGRVLAVPGGERSYDDRGEALSAVERVRREAQDAAVTE